MQAPRMVVTDMDGTVLDGTGTRVSARNAAVLRRAADAGARVVIATGRPIWWLGPVIDAGFTGTAVCMNGAIVYDIAAGRITSSTLMTPAVMSAFVDGLAEHAAGFALAVERPGLDLSSCWAEATYRHPWSLGEFQMAERNDLLSESAAKMLVSGGRDSQDLADAASRIGSVDVHVTFSSGDGLIEVAAGGVNKGAALAGLAQSWGIDPAHAIAFGDMPNDLEMLTWAGHAVAMANAHPSVTAIAGEIAPPNHEDGVAAVLERWF